MKCGIHVVNVAPLGVTVRTSKARANDVKTSMCSTLTGCHGSCLFVDSSWLLVLPRTHTQSPPQMKIQVVSSHDNASFHAFRWRRRPVPRCRAAEPIGLNTKKLFI